MQEAGGRRNVKLFLWDSDWDLTCVGIVITKSSNPRPRIQSRRLPLQECRDYFFNFLGTEPRRFFLQ